MPTLPPSPWGEFLLELDAALTERCTLPCFGGWVITELYNLSRVTNDIDVLDVAPPNMVRTLMEIAGSNSPLANRHRVYLDVVVIANPPMEYDTRLRPIYEGAFKHLSLCVMDPYDIALTKLKRDNDKDFQDILQLAETVPFDLELFERRYIEELRDNTTGRPEDNDEVFYRWSDSILEVRAAKHK